MPQLEKGGKWVFGWCVIGDEKKIQIPPEAYNEYGFKTGMRVEITLGSKKSGGFAVCNPEVLSTSPLETRVIGESFIDENRQFTLPGDLLPPDGARLLAVRGSGLGLSFIHCGPIVSLAENHPELEVFEV